MLIDRTHKPWFVASVLTLTVAASAYWGMAKHSMHGPTGGSVLGLLLGIGGSLLMIFAALLAVRKRLPTWRVGSAQFWLRGHLWLGTLGFVLVLFHAGFQWGGLLENLLWVSFGLVVATGFAGVVLQQVIPRLLTTRVPLETMVAQIPFLSKTMLFRADQLIAKQAGVLNVDFEPLKPFAEEALKQQRVLKRESDFPKELAKVYANVPLPEADTKKPHAPVLAEIVNTKSAPAIPVLPSSTTSADAPAVKPKSPLELMREKAASKSAAGETSVPASANPDVPPAVATEKKLSPLEQMRAKQAAAKAATETDAASPAPRVEPTAPAPAAETEKKLSPLEQMRAKMAAKSAPSNSAAPSTGEVSVPAKTEKKLSPLEQMQAKLAAKKPAPATDAVEAHKPLTVENPTTAEVKKVTPVVKPSVEKPVAVTPPKPKLAAPIPSALLTELSDFHIRAVRSFLSTGRSPQYRLDDHISARRVFARLRADLPAELHDSIQQLEELCEERRQFNTQLRLHRWLHWWLILHIPPSIALLVLFVAHVIVSLRVVPFGR